MKSASLAIALSGAVLAVTAPEAQAGGHRGCLAVRPHGGGAAPYVPHFHSHPHTRIEDPYWYYCEEAGTYYPYVKECSGGWQRVLPRAAPLG